MKSWITHVILFLLLAGCAFIKSPPVGISGVVQLGRVSRAVVRIYTLNSQGQRVLPHLEETETNGSGEYWLRISPNKGPFEIVASGSADGETKYTDEITNQEVTLSASDELSTVIDKGHKDPAPITPLTTFVRNLVVNQIASEGLGNFANIKSSAVTKVARIWAVSEEAVEATPANPSSITGSSLKAVESAFPMYVYSQFLQDQGSTSTSISSLQTHLDDSAAGTMSRAWTMGMKVARYKALSKSEAFSSVSYLSKNFLEDPTSDESASEATLEIKSANSSGIEIQSTFNQTVASLSSSNVWIKNGTLNSGSISGSGKVYTFRVSVTDSSQPAFVIVSKDGAQSNVIEIAQSPTNLNPVVGSGEVELSWDKPTDITSDITDYVIEYSSNSGSTWSVFVDTESAETNATVSGLTNGTSYVFRVAAKNEFGQGSYSESSSSVTPRTVPGAPTGVSGTPGPSQVSLLWTAPSSNGGALISDYRIKYSSNGGETWLTFPDEISTETSAVVTGLVNGTEYLFQVAAINEAGVGSYTQSAIGITPVTIPDAPTAVSGTPYSGKVFLTWTAPASNGGSDIEDYEVQYSSNAGTDWNTFVHDSALGTSVLVTGLTNGTSYIFRVAAMSVGAGLGNYSSPSSSVTPALPPDPTSPQATANHSSQITLSWGVEDTETGITAAASFQIAYQTGNTAPANCTSGTVISSGAIGSSTSYAVTGLSTYDYAFRVCAKDAYGALSSGVTTTGTTGWYSEAYLKAPNNSQYDYFGWSVSISGDTVVVGSPYEDNSVTTITNGSFTSADSGSTEDSGAAYVFRRTGSSWANEAYLKVPNNSDYDNFGYSVSISGDTVVVGAPYEDSNQTTITNGTTGSSNNGVSFDSGAAYVFKRNNSTWANEAYLKAPNNSDYDNFGWSVSISGDTVVVGSPYEDNSVTTITNGTFTSADTSTSTDSGAAYVFKRTGSTWANEAYLKAPNKSSRDYFGTSVSISGDTVVVGSHSEDNSVTTITNGTFTSADTSTSLDSGAAYVFRRTGSSWANEAYLKAPNNSLRDNFGWSVSVSGDTVVVGVPYEDSNQTTITNGTTASSDNSSSASGAAYVFKRSGSSWAQEAYIKAPNVDGGDYFGNSVSISGNTIAVGAYGEGSNQTTITNGTTASSDNSLCGSGAAYVFKRSGSGTGSGPWFNEAYLKPPNPDSYGYDDLCYGANFGMSASISGDTIVVGAEMERSNQTTITNGTTASLDISSESSGAVYVFRRFASTGLTPSITSVSPPTGISIGGDTLIIYGSGFMSGATVTVGGNTCTNPIWQSYNEILCTLPAGTAGSASVVVTNPGGASGSDSSSFTYVSYVPANNPSAFTATANHSSQITLSWTSGGGTTTSFQLAYQSGLTPPADCTSGTVISYTTLGPSTSYALTGLTTQDYAFRVCARDAYGTLSSGVTTTRTTGWYSEAYLKAPNNSEVDFFGWSVSISGDTVVVGSYGEDNSVTTITNGTFTSADSATSADSGAAYVFRRTGSSWANEAYLKAPNNSSRDYFGNSVSISGDTVVVGSPYEDNSVTTITNGTFTSADTSTSGDSGAAYVFRRTGSSWANEAYLKAPNNSEYDYFGYSVSISGDTVVVGSPCESNSVTTITNGTFTSADTATSEVSGAVYVFRRASTTGLTPSITSLSPSSFSLAGGGTVSVFGSGFQSGATVTIGGNNCTNPIWQSYNEILCTLPAGTGGSASVVVTNPGGASGTSSSGFTYTAPANPTGFSVSVDSRTQVTLSWTNGGGDTVGYQVAYQTGTTAPSDCSSGTVVSYTTIGSYTSIILTGLTSEDYAFRVCGRDNLGYLSSGTTTTASLGWYQEAYLKAPNPDLLDNFGGQNGLSISGDTIVVGAYWEDSNQTTITNGTTASSNNSSSASGAAYVFKRSGSTWAQEAYLKAPNAEANDNFGLSASISGDTIVVGTPLEDSNQTTITNGTTASSDNSSNASGAAYVFKRSGSTWAQEAYLKASNPDISDRFGNTVDISGDTIVVGAHFESSNQTTITNGTVVSSNNSLMGSGAVYVYKRSGSTWAQEAYLKAPNPDVFDVLAQYGLSISGDTIVVGAHLEDSNQTTITNGTTASSDNSSSASGAAYVFKRSGSTWAQEAYLKAANAEAGDYFGWSVSVSGDTIVVGAYGEDSNQTTITNGTTASSNNSSSASGAAYVFKRSGSTWAQEAYLKAPNAEASDSFGYAVSISGDTIVVGAYWEDSNQTTITNGTTASSDNSSSASGAAYVFRIKDIPVTPAVTSVTPSTGAVSGINAVIFGNNFRKDATVTIGGTACTSITVQGPNEIICTLPYKAAGSHSIVVTNPDASTSNTDITITY